MVHPHLFKNRAICAGAAMIAMFVISGAAHGGGVLYVDDDAPPGGDGLSWDTAYRFFQDGLTSAAKRGVTEIRVGQGTYKPDRDEANPDGTDNRSASFDLLSNVALMGGYAGIGAKDPDERDIALYETNLSGDLLGNDGPNFENNDENSYHVVTSSSVDETAVLDGFTMTAGNANSPFLPHNQGGGMYNDQSSPTVINCIFSGNNAGGCTGGNGGGGGGMANHSSSPTVINCVFSGNNAETHCGGFGDWGGGGMGNIWDSNPTLINCIFIGNTVTPLLGVARGGGLSGRATITNCAFIGNSADFGGGMHAFFGSILTDTTFSANSAILGGGIYMVTSNTVLTNCTFTGNSASWLGGGMFSSSSSTPTLTSCTFSHNDAGFQGGGMYIGSGSPTLTDCTFTNNSADFGGGIYDLATSTTTLTNCTFSDNSAISGGGGMYSTDATSPAITGCTFSGTPARLRRTNRLSM